MTIIHSQKYKSSKIILKDIKNIQGKKKYIRKEKVDDIKNSVDKFIKKNNRKKKVQTIKFTFTDPNVPKLIDSDEYLQTQVPCLNNSVPLLNHFMPTSVHEDLEELEIDFVETENYGPKQFSELDIIYPECIDKLNETSLSTLMIQNKSLGKKSLKLIEKIKSTEMEIETITKFKCLICVEYFKYPLISVLCWHVFCKECWMKCLGVKKLCPQCQAIVHPSELRKINL